MFPRLKSALNVMRITHATDIKNAMEVLNRVSQNGYQECLQQLIAHGGYFERNAVLMVLCFVLLKNKVI
jgi:pantothenate kinase